MDDRKKQHNKLHGQEMIVYYESLSVQTQKFPGGIVLAL
jgi:hypothetical protein